MKKETTARLKWLSLPFLVTKLINGLYRLYFLLLYDVYIDVLGDFGVGVTEEFRDDFDVTSVMEKHRCKGMPQGVYTDTF